MQINKDTINKLKTVSFEKKKAFFQNLINSNKISLENKKDIIKKIMKISDDDDILKICNHILKKIEGNNDPKPKEVVLEKEKLDNTSRNKIKNEIQEIIRKKGLYNMEKMKKIRAYIDKYDDGEIQYILRYAYHGIKKRISLQSKAKIKDISQILGGDDPDMKIEVLKKLQENQTKEHNELILNTLKHEEDPFVIATLISTYGRIGDSTQAPVFRKYLEDPDPRIRANTVECLINLKNPKLYRDVMMMIEDPDPRVKANVATLLSNEGKYRMLEIIKAMVYSGKENQLRSAAFVLDKLKKDESAAKLLSIAQMKLKKIERDSVFDEIKKHISDALEQDDQDEDDDKNLSEKVSSGIKRFFGKKSK
ncbi:MAG: hypothetical protein C0601_01590 [Candidatus Muiribacterium halophilum]|uniref:HEAT repeat domain-containing protein n=1 Tax=Muiribacterium halophilum TaxID=2053465 RepID=A0A2N5ZLM8_MUIH1|nr:MAG: hypothetical protein C0601_01590 [Candidatus Muirbacterium halophilum]